MSEANDDLDPTLIVKGARLAPPPEPPPPQLGRYLVVEEVGVGGMGRVLRAYDPKLRREVALKQLGRLVDGSRGRARIEREAQAMARLNHPNLVAVYDVEQDGDAMYIAMEFVEGETLRHWLDQRSRTWPEVVPVFLQAGRGLAAAHAGGVIHRDFKPNNVMVGHDGRVRVMDFGIARGAIDVHTSGEHVANTPAEDSGTPRSASDPTDASQLLGTPPYMSPEQHRGEPAEASADQYAFCISMFEALYGERPFAGRDPDAIAAAKQLGPGEFPRTRSVPGWLRAVIRRGLAPAPAERWPDMGALLDALEHGNARARWRTVVAIAAIAMLGVAAILITRVLSHRAALAQCEVEGLQIGEVWNDAVGQQIAAAFAASGAHDGELTAEKLRPWLGRRVDEWTRLRTTACVAAEIDGSWSPETSDRAMWCLYERKDELASLVQELLIADAGGVQNAVLAAAALPSAASCVDIDRLSMLPPPPPSERRAAVHDIRRQLASARAQRYAGRFEHGRALASEALTRAQATEWPPLTVAARLELAVAYRMLGAHADAERELREAYFAAADADSPQDAADASIALVDLVGYRQARPDDGRLWARLAQISLRSLSEDELRRAQLLNNLGNIAELEGDGRTAREMHEQALAMRQSVLGPDHPEVTKSLNNLANATMDADPFAALALHERALAIREAILGPRHLDVSFSLLNLSSSYAEIGDVDVALPLAERMQAIREAVLSAEHTDTVIALGVLATARVRVGDLAGARMDYERASDLAAEVLPDEHPERANLLGGLGTVYENLGWSSDALRCYERAAAISHAAPNPDVNRRVFAVEGLVRIARSDGAWARAIQLLRDELAFRRRIGTPRRLAIVAELLANTIRDTGGDLVEARELAIEAERIYLRLDDIPSTLDAQELVRALAPRQP